MNQCTVRQLRAPNVHVIEASERGWGGGGDMFKKIMSKNFQTMETINPQIQMGQAVSTRNVK